MINVAKEIERVNDIFKASGVQTRNAEKEIKKVIPEKPKVEDVLEEKKEKMSEIAQKAIDIDNTEKEKLEKQKKRTIIPRYVITNHLQAYIVDYIRAQMKQGYTLDILKQHLLNQGYKPMDVLKAINHIKNIPEDMQSRTGFEFKEFKQADEELPQESIIKPKESVVKKSYLLNEKQKQVLELISKCPFLGTAQVYQYLKLSARKGNELRKQLIEMGLIKVEEQRNDKGWKKILTLTEEANTALENPGNIAE